MEPRDVGDRAIACPAAWYALRVRSNHEQRVEADLTARGYETFFPTWCEVTRWTDREKRVIRPLFPGYGFARFEALTQLIEILQTRGIASVLGNTEFSPEPVEEADILRLRQVLDATPTARPCPYVAGERVRVETGPFAGTEGIIQRTKGSARLVVSIEILRRAVSVELDAATVTLAQT